MAEPVRFQHFEVPLREDGSLFELGRGAMGITYKAFDTNLRCFVALKVINAAYLSSDVARQRFLREARAAAALRHPNVATVFHLGEEDGNCFYAMEFVDGETVEAILRREGAISPAVALEVVAQVAKALAAAEKQGLVHRDIKPSNLMLVREDDHDFTVKVIDFGLAKSSAGGNEEAATLTVGGFLGTPHFASPEQLEEREIDVRSDIYSLGVTLYYMLAGRAPFSGSLAQVMSQHLHRDPPLETLAGQSPAVLSLLRHMLAKDPAARPQSASELRREVEACLAGLASAPAPPSACPPADGEVFETLAMEEPPPPPTEPIPPEPAPPPLPPAKKPSSSRLWAVLGVLLLLGAAAAYFVVSAVSRPRNPEPSPSPQPETSATPEAVAAANPEPTPLTSPTATPAATPTASPVPTATATPDPVTATIATVRQTAAEDPAGALTSLLELCKSHPDRPEAREAVVEFVSSAKDRQLSPGQSVALLEPLEAAAAMDIVDAQLFLGGQLRESDPKASLKWTLAAARNDNSEAMLLAGLMLSNGVGSGSPDLREAAAWFQRAAAAGNPRAMALLAECYLLSKGVTRDPRLALDWLNKAAAQNDVVALDKLGNLYKKGIPGIVQPDLKKSFSYFSEAKDLGYLPAFSNLGALFMTAPEGMRDEKLGVDLFREGAEKGDPRSAYFYALSLAEGHGGLEKDPDAARKWFVSAAELGDADALAWCKNNGVPVTPVPPR